MRYLYIRRSACLTCGCAMFVKNDIPNGICALLKTSASSATSPVKSHCQPRSTQNFTRFKLHTCCCDVWVHVEDNARTRRRGSEDDRVCGCEGSFQAFYFLLTAVTHLLDVMRKLSQKCDQVVLMLEDCNCRSPLISLLERLHQTSLRSLVAPPASLGIFHIGLDKLLAENIPMQEIGYFQVLRCSFHCQINKSI